MNLLKKNRLIDTETNLWLPKGREVDVHKAEFTPGY